VIHLNFSNLWAPAGRQPAVTNAEIMRHQARGIFSRVPRDAAFSRARKITTSRAEINNRGLQWYTFSEGRSHQDYYKRPREATQGNRLPVFGTRREARFCFRSGTRSTVKLPPEIRKPAVKPAASPLSPELVSSQWKLIPLQLSPPRRTRPPRDFLTTWDVRVRRLTSPFWKPPSLLSPLREPPRRPAQVHRGILCRPSTCDQATQGGPSWETSSDDEADQPSERTSTGTQVVEADLEDDQERPYTPPGTPPSLRRWGPRKHTSTQPTLEWRERL